jgi:hypothetical protein
MVEPWGFEANVPEEVRADKGARTRWANAYDTKHCFYSGFEGVNVKLRINKDNPIEKMLALVVDYDRPSMEFGHAVDAVLSHKIQYRPNYISQTLSGGIRLVWIMEKPLNMNTFMAKKFHKHMRKEFELVKLLPGLDDEALKDPSKYYEVGENWKQLSSDPIPTTVSLTWAMSAFGKMSISTELEADVPLDRVREALVKKYPDIEFPDLELGIRMKRFWDTSATNESAAFLMAGGFYCHTGDEGFMGWEKLISRSFMKEFEVEQTGEVIDRFWYDGQKYLSRNPVKDEWMVQNLTDVTLNLCVSYGLSKAPDKKGEASPIDRILHQVQLQKGVEAFAKFVHRPEGEIMSQGLPYVNISKVTAMPPSGTSGEWGEHFPWLAQYFDGLLVDPHQKNILLAWWKHYYEGALKQEPTRGQVMIISGPPACGKTLFNIRMLAPSVGGGVDASEYYINGDDFGGTYFSYGLHMVDDGEPGRHPNAQKATASRYKKTAASTLFSVNQKYEKRTSVEWSGRVCVTMNSDPESLKTMPELQQTLEDKLIVLRAEEPTELFETSENVEEMIKDQLPHLLQWLVDWTPPETVESGTRYGVISYCDKSLRHSMEADTADALFFELLDTFLAEVKAEAKTATAITMRTTDLVARMKDCELIRSMMGSYKATHIGHILGRHASKGYGFTYKRTAAGSNWTIQFDYRPKEEA